MEVKEFLDTSGVTYVTSRHAPAFTAQGMAALEHEPGRYVAKPVIVRADDRYLMCVLPAPSHLDLAKLKSQLTAKTVELAQEHEIAELFPGCDLGAEPPFGNLYELPTLMDKSMEADDHILFQAGSHEEAVRIEMADYRRLVEPRIMDLSYHAPSS